MDDVSDRADPSPTPKGGVFSARRINLKKESFRYSEAFFFF